MKILQSVTASEVTRKTIEARAAAVKDNSPAPRLFSDLYYDSDLPPDSDVELKLSSCSGKAKAIRKSDREPYDGFNERTEEEAQLWVDSRKHPLMKEANKETQNPFVGCMFDRNGKELPGMTWAMSVEDKVSLFGNACTEASIHRTPAPYAVMVRIFAAIRERRITRNLQFYGRGIHLQTMLTQADLEVSSLDDRYFVGFTFGNTMAPSRLGPSWVNQSDLIFFIDSVADGYLTEEDLLTKNAWFWRDLIGRAKANRSKYSKEARKAIKAERRNRNCNRRLANNRDSWIRCPACVGTTTGDDFRCPRRCDLTELYRRGKAVRNNRACLTDDAFVLTAVDRMLLRYG